jgi:predicted nucleic acid-binding Zn ribbon protein
VRVACPQCRETFLTRGPDQKQKVYCSDRCRTAASRERRSTRRLRADLPIDVIALIEREVARRRAAGQSAKIATKQRITAEALAVGLAALAPESKPG